MTPCKTMGGVHAASYDDRFILDGAITFNAAVISNDNFQDLRKVYLSFNPIW